MHVRNQDAWKNIVNASKQAFSAVIIANAANAKTMMDPLIEEYCLIVMDRLVSLCHQQFQTCSGSLQVESLAQAPQIPCCKINQCLILHMAIIKLIVRVAKAPSWICLLNNSQSSQNYRIVERLTCISSKNKILSCSATNSV